MRSLLTTFRPQAKKYRAVNKLSLNGETQWGPSGPHFFCLNGALANPAACGGAGTVRRIGPYLVQGRTVFAREGVIIAGLTHEFAKGVARSRDFKNITSWRILERTVSYIQSRPPGGLPPGEHRPGSLERYSSDVRYDIMVTGTIFAFVA